MECTASPCGWSLRRLEQQTTEKTKREDLPRGSPQDEIGGPLRARSPCCYSLVLWRPVKWMPIFRPDPFARPNSNPPTRTSSASPIELSADRSGGSRHTPIAALPEGAGVFLPRAAALGACAVGTVHKEVRLSASSRPMSEGPLLRVEGDVASHFPHRFFPTAPKTGRLLGTTEHAPHQVELYPGKSCSSRAFI
jgi:hypothetical protein